MQCTCGSKRICSIRARCKDQFHAEMVNNPIIKVAGYPDDRFGITNGSGDDVAFDLCMDCGKVQGEFPITDEQLINDE